MRKTLMMAAVAAATICEAAEKSWKAGVVDWPADGWTNGNYWDGGAPGEGDTAMFAVAVTARVDSASASTVSKLGLVSAKWQYGTVLLIDASSSMTLGCMLGGTLNVVKKGNGHLTFTSDRRTQAVYGFYTDLAARTCRIEAGKVSSPSSAAAICLPNQLTVCSGAELHLSGNGNYLISQGLFGDGLVTNDTATTRNIQIGTNGSTYDGSFGGTIAGNISISVLCRQSFTGNASTYTGATAAWYGNGDLATSGVLGFAKLGLYADTASSIGGATYIDSQFGGRLLYLGTGETASKQVLLRTQDSRAPILDGGRHGGLKLAGEVTLHNAVSTYNLMSEVVLDGSNAAPCVISGNYAIDRTSPGGNPVTAYTIKKGSGTWRFTGNKFNASGGFGVDEGTLQFDSIANAGTACSLGKATLLAEPYYGEWNADKVKPYAYRLGSETSTNAVFEFVGATASSATDRPAVLGGDAHLRASGASGAPLQFSGVSALAEGAQTKTLFIDGTNSDNNVLSEVSDGNGKLSVVKDGEGSWTLNGNQTFSGDLAVRRGTLTIEKNKLYSWFRITVKCVSNTAQSRLFIPEIGLFDKDGHNVSRGLEFVPGTVENVGGINYTSSHRPASLAPGQFTLSNTTAARYRLHDTMGFANMFDGTANSTWFSGTWNKVPDGQTAAYDFGIVVRLDTAKPIVAFDIAQYSGDIYPTWMTVEASTDCSTWETVYDNDENRMTSKYASYWYSNGNGIAVDPRNVSGGAGLALSASSLSDEFSVLENVESYSVSTGAVLRFSGNYVPTLSKLVVDGAAGMGSISGFKFATDVTIDIRNLPSSTTTIPANLGGILGFEDVESWTFTMDGQPPRFRSFSVSPEGVKVFKDGLRLIFR